MADARQKSRSQSMFSKLRLSGWVQGCCWVLNSGPCHPFYLLMRKPEQKSIMKGGFRGSLGGQVKPASKRNKAYTMVAAEAPDFNGLARVRDS